MDSNDVTFEQVDQQLQKADISEFQQGGRSHFNAKAVAEAPADVIEPICKIYRLVRPILLWVLKILPKKWADVVRTFMSLMDVLCP